MSKIFKPRRGKASTMLGTKASTVLAAGEMFIELPDTGVGTGICKMKMGDGVTAYSSLPYAMGGDIASTEITGSIVEDTSATAAAALANVTTGRTLGAIVGSLRRACQLNAQSIATLNDEKSNKFYYYSTYKNFTIEPATYQNIEIPLSYPSGYKYFCIINVFSLSTWFLIANRHISNGKMIVMIRNLSTTDGASTGDVCANILLIAQ